MSHTCGAEHCGHVRAAQALAYPTWSTPWRADAQGLHTTALTYTAVSTSKNTKRYTNTFKAKVYHLRIIFFVLLWFKFVQKCQFSSNFQLARLFCSNDMCLSKTLILIPLWVSLSQYTCSMLTFKKKISAFDRFVPGSGLASDHFHTNNAWVDRKRLLAWERGFGSEGVAPGVGYLSGLS